MNFNIYNNNTIFNIDYTGLNKLDIMNNIQCTWHVELSSMISVVHDQPPAGPDYGCRRP